MPCLDRFTVNGEDDIEAVEEAISYFMSASEGNFGSGSYEDVPELVETRRRLSRLQDRFDVRRQQHEL